MPAPTDPPIIITGGSVTIEFDDDQIKKVSPGKHHHPDKKINRVEVTGDGINFARDITDGKVKVTIYFENKP
ncbi:MAG: hypothetical protein QOC99_1444 [Acidobacteriota bacterium]|jgi:hypothetical protein|nr:hypothetical protein [Acidobacteriota bacterium]